MQVTYWLGALGGAAISTYFSGTWGQEEGVVPWVGFVGGAMMLFGARMASGCTRYLYDNNIVFSEKSIINLLSLSLSLSLSASPLQWSWTFWYGTSFTSSFSCCSLHVCWRHGTCLYTISSLTITTIILYNYY